LARQRSTLRRAGEINGSPSRDNPVHWRSEFAIPARVSQRASGPISRQPAGEWHVSRKSVSGQTAESTVSAGWALKHHFWVDVFGAHYSLLGHGKIAENLLSLEFRFDARDGNVTNRFTFDRAANTWTSLIRQPENGEWKTFAEEKWTRIAPKS
jgi:hypothetical protein